MMSGKAKKVSKSKKKIILFAALATILSLWFDAEITGGLFRSMNLRRLSLNLGNGTCEWVAAIQWDDPSFPSDANFTKTVIAGYPSGDKRMIYLQLEGLTGLSARDEWEFIMLAMTNQPFIKANYPHHEGIWGWGDAGDQVMLVVGDLKKNLIQYHDILWDIGYAQTWEEAFERMFNLYREDELPGEHINPPVEDFLVWRDLRAFDEIHWYSWLIDYYMEGGLMRDMFNHQMTIPSQWHMATLPNFFTKFEVRHGRFVDENETVADNYDPMCATLSKGCYPVQVIDPAKLMDPDYGPAEARKLAELINGTQGFEDWMIEEEAWECIWNELIVNRKGTKTFMDRDIPYDDYIFSFEIRNEMWHEINRLIEKYEVYNDTVSVDLVNILTGHRDELGIEEPVDPLTYDELMGYHLAFPPFFPNQKMFKSDDDFFVNVHEKYSDPNGTNYLTIIDRRRAWFEAEMEKKRERKIVVRYYDTDGIPAGGLQSLVPYAFDTTYSINYKLTAGNFAKSGKNTNVGALFSGYIFIDEVTKKMSLTFQDGARVYIDGQMVVDRAQTRSWPMTQYWSVTEGVRKIDIEFFTRNFESTLILKYGATRDLMRVVPPRAWATAEGQRKYRELTRMEEELEKDLKVLKETDFMGPMTRAEFNARQLAAGGPSGPTVTSETRNLFKGEDSRKMIQEDQFRQLPKAEQLEIMRSTFDR